MWNEKRESMPRAELEELQLNQMRLLLARLEKRVAFYQHQFKKSKIDTSKFSSLKDLAHLPFTTKADLRDEYPLGMLAVDSKEINRYHASSGTRGKSTLVAYTAGDLSNWTELVARSLIAAGTRAGDVIHNAYGYGLFTGGLGLHSGIEKINAAVVPASGGKTAQQIVLLKDLGARVLCSTPSYALRISSALAEAGITAADLKLEIGIFGAEPWTEPMRSRIELELGIKAVDIYGLSEIMGPGVSIECAEFRCGMHIWEDHFLAEIIDPVTQEVLPEGKEGELVLTTLEKEALPLLRFRTGDLSILTRDKCKCGRTMARMARVRARMDDMLIVRGVNVYPSEIENLLLQVDELAPHYLIILTRPGELDELTIQVERQVPSIQSKEKIVIEAAASSEAKATAERLSASSVSSASSSSALSAGDLSSRVQDLIKESLGLSAKIQIVPANTLPRSEGKAARIIDRRPA